MMGETEFWFLTIVIFVGFLVWRKAYVTSHRGEWEDKKEDIRQRAAKFDMENSCNHEWETVSDKTISPAMNNFPDGLKPKAYKDWQLVERHVVIMKCLKCGEVEEYVNDGVKEDD
jgi:hypothetical protein